MMDGWELLKTMTSVRPDFALTRGPLSIEVSFREMGSACL